MAKSAVLMNKLTPILDIEIEAGTIMNIGEVLDENMMPLQLKNDRSLEAVNKWFTSRRLPDKREGLEEARKLFRGFEQDRHFFSLSDQYWVKTSKNDKWEELNYFTNPYSLEVGRIFFEPWNVDKAKILKPSPDRTTNGVLRKRWVLDEKNKSHLIKTGSIKYHQEPLSEVLASIMLKKLNILEFVEYSLIVDGMRFCSKCPNFITENTEFVPASAVYNMEKRPESVSVYEHLLRMCKNLNIIGAKEYIDKMIVADHIICNNDRHLGNFGFLRSANDGKLMGFAPLFDFGSAYWGTSEKVELKKSRLFPNEEKTIFKNAGKRGMLKGARSNKTMTNLIKMYPDIADKKKKAIIRMINEVDIEIDKADYTLSKEKEEREIKKRKEEMEIELR